MLWFCSVLEQIPHIIKVCVCLNIPLSCLHIVSNYGFSTDKCSFVTWTNTDLLSNRDLETKLKQINVNRYTEPLWRKCVWKWRVQNVGSCVQTSLCMCAEHVFAYPCQQCRYELWWRYGNSHTSLAICEGNPTVTADSPHKGQWCKVLVGVLRRCDRRWCHCNTQHILISPYYIEDISSDPTVLAVNGNYR